VAAYNHDLDEWEYVEKAAPGNAGTYTMDVAAFSGKTVQAYVGVFTADKKSVSDSLFAGTVSIL